MNYRILIFLLIASLMVFGLACGSSDDGTLADSTGDPDPLTDDDDDDLPIGDDDATDDDTTGDDDDDDTPFVGDLTELFVVPPLAVEPIGHTSEFQANGRDTSGNDVSNVPVDWSLSDTTVAEIDQDGIATGTANGKVTVTATWVNPGDGNTLTATAELWVMGDVLVVDGNGKLGLIDIGTNTSDADYLGIAIDGTPQSVSIVHEQLGTLVVQGDQSYASLFDLDPDAVAHLGDTALNSNHHGTASVTHEENVYIVEPSTHNLSIFNPSSDDPAASSMGGLILLNDLSYPSDIVVNEAFMVALGSNSLPGESLFNEGAIYFIEKSGDTINAIMDIREVPFINPIKVDGSMQYAVVLSSDAGGGAGSQLDLYNVQTHADSVSIPGTMASLAIQGINQVWVGDAMAPNLYIYDFDADAWIAGLDDPIELPTGSSVPVLKSHPARGEVWAADDEGHVYMFDTETLSQEFDFTLTGFDVKDIEIW